MDLYHHDGQGNIYGMDRSGTITVADTIDTHRVIDCYDNAHTTSTTYRYTPGSCTIK